jgi:L-aspartate oxidase
MTRSSIKPCAPSADEGDIPDIMWRNVGLFRDGAKLHRTVSVLEYRWTDLQQRLKQGRLPAAEWRDANLLTVARLIARAALRREESRGAHYRDDFPAHDEVHWNKRVGEYRD